MGSGWVSCGKGALGRQESRARPRCLAERRGASGPRVGVCLVLQSHLLNEGGGQPPPRRGPWGAGLGDLPGFPPSLPCGLAGMARASPVP